MPKIMFSLGQVAHFWVVVPLIGGRVRAEEVKVALVVNIPDMDTLCLVQNDWDGCVVVSTILILSCYELHSWKEAVSLIAVNQAGTWKAQVTLTLCCTEDEA